MSRDGISDYIERRNWVEYNEKIVRRGELYLFLYLWDEEIERTNAIEEEGSHTQIVNVHR